jgi:hypothetical protein
LHLLVSGFVLARLGSHSVALLPGRGREGRCTAALPSEVAETTPGGSKPRRGHLQPKESCPEPDLTPQTASGDARIVKQTRISATILPMPFNCPPRVCVLRSRPTRPRSEPPRSQFERLLRQVCRERANKTCAKAAGRLVASSKRCTQTYWGLRGACASSYQTQESSKAAERTQTTTTTARKDHNRPTKPH